MVTENAIFYDTKGTEISKERFVKIYSDIYYYLNDLNLEKKIETIYEKGFEMDGEDLVDFLWWKTGGTKSEKVIVTQYGKSINVSDIKAIPRNLRDVIQNNERTSPKSIYEHIIGQKIKNLGSVYTLAITSAFLKGELPIYDRFACVALNAIDNNTSFRKFVKYKELPDKMNVKGVMNAYYSYIDLLNKHFDEAWKGSREIDRALWTYGHLFCKYQKDFKPENSLS